MSIGTVQPTPTTSEVNQTPNTHSLAQCLWRKHERLQQQQQNIDKGQNILPVSAVSTTMTPIVRSLAQHQRHKCERQQQQQQRGQSTPIINEVPQISNARSLGQCLWSISKSQGQSVCHVGLYLSLLSSFCTWAPICSSFTSPQNIKILLPEGIVESLTTNIVYKEILIH